MSCTYHYVTCTWWRVIRPFPTFRGNDRVRISIETSPRTRDTAVTSHAMRQRNDLKLTLRQCKLNFDPSDLKFQFGFLVELLSLFFLLWGRYKGGGFLACEPPDPHRGRCVLRMHLLCTSLVLLREVQHVTCLNVVL